ncbi:hypothetical protein ACP4OV_004446 [Aristida adscensionis]
MKRTSFLHIVLLLALAAYGGVAPASAGGSWQAVQPKLGVSAMHMQLLHTDRVILFDRNEVGPSNLTFARCPTNTGGDCTAHAAEYAVASNSFRPLTILTDTWCSSGYVDKDGTLVQNGGFNTAGNRTVRTMRACGDASCDWVEKQFVLATGRWYGTNQKLPSGGAIIVGGLGQATYEFLPKVGNVASDGLFFQMQSFLGSGVSTLYPFLHLNVDGNLFVFADNRYVLFDYKAGVVVPNRTYPALPAGELRTNPNAGSSVLLPLNLSSNPVEAEVLICGGAPRQTTRVAALKTCARIKITDPNPTWTVETMPSERVMGDMILLPNGEVAIINGAKRGVAGWGAADTPNLTPVIYRPSDRQFVPQAPATTPRMYHSSVVLLRDGRLLVGGSNPQERYQFTGVQFPTEIGLDAFSPDYLDGAFTDRRPKIAVPKPDGDPVHVTYGGSLELLFGIKVRDPVVSVTLVAPSFTTHSFAQNQRVLFLQAQVEQAKAFVVGAGEPVLLNGVYNATVQMPAKPEYAPPGYYMLFAVNGRIPSEKGIWVHIQ